MRAPPAPPAPCGPASLPDSTSPPLRSQLLRRTPLPGVPPHKPRSLRIFFAGGTGYSRGPDGLKLDGVGEAVRSVWLRGRRGTCLSPIQRGRRPLGQQASRGDWRRRRSRRPERRGKVPPRHRPRSSKSGTSKPPSGVTRPTTPRVASVPRESRRGLHMSARRYERGRGDRAGSRKGLDPGYPSSTGGRRVRRVDARPPTQSTPCDCVHPTFQPPSDRALRGLFSLALLRRGTARPRVPKREDALRRQLSNAPATRGGCPTLGCEATNEHLQIAGLRGARAASERQGRTEAGSWMRRSVVVGSGSVASGG